MDKKNSSNKKDNKLDKQKPDDSIRELKNANEEEPKIFKISRKAKPIDRKDFLMSVGKVTAFTALGSLLTRCDESEYDITSYDGVCKCHAVCTCNYETEDGDKHKDKSSQYDRTIVNERCTCDTVCTCNSVCSCDSVCTCDSEGSSCSSCSSCGYWYPC